MKTRFLAGLLALWLIALLCAMVGVGAALGRKGDRSASAGAPGIAGRMAQPVTLVDIEVGGFTYVRAWSDGTVERWRLNVVGDRWTTVEEIATDLTGNSGR